MATPDRPETRPPPPLRMVRAPSSDRVKETGPRFEATKIALILIPSPRDVLVPKVNQT
ncbi:hypothetical protein GCM10017600_46880 [Streptosporangium carneum]|uniref:Uncharacterized protein n=1 Tax=Streptosporangium carneum TaxID=47481 RepID=A0A9W6I3B8_9ACTN|nr:hypothetical protein GCM10017600_46880 [Streptosporangium carneum]